MSDTSRTNIQLAGALALGFALVLLFAGAPLGTFLLALVAAGLFWATTMGAEHN